MLTEKKCKNRKRLLVKKNQVFSFVTVDELEKINANCDGESF